MVSQSDTSAGQSGVGVSLLVTKSIRMSISHRRIQNWGDSGPSELMRSLKTDSRGSRPR